MKTFARIVVLTVSILLSLVFVQYAVNAQSHETKSADATRAQGADPSKDAIKVFSLVNSDAELLTQTMQPLFAKTSDTLIVYDKRTNSIIARGAESELAILEALLRRLDEAPTYSIRNIGAEQTDTVERREESEVNSSSAPVAH